MKKWRKPIAFLIILCIVVMGVLTGYKLYNRNNGSDTTPIPSNGIVSSAAFKKIKSNSDMAIFTGSSDKISYEWLFYGGSIEKPEDTNLGVEFLNDDCDKIKKEQGTEYVQCFIFSDQSTINNSPTLTIDMPFHWDCSSADIYKYDDAQNKYITFCGATFENGDKSVSVTFPVMDRKGKFAIVGKGEEIKTAVAQKPKDESNSGDKSENKSEDKDKEEEQEYITDSIDKSSSGGKDKYMTDPVPEGKPKPVEPQDVEVDESTSKYCTLSVRCDTLLKPENYKVCEDNGKADMIPADGIIFGATQVEFHDGESVFDVLKREMRNNGIQMEFSMTPAYNSAYIEGIHNLYEFDGGQNSGWMYKVNGWFPNYGCSRYQLKEGDTIEFVYTCDLGRDVGGYVGDL